MEEVPMMFEEVDVQERSTHIISEPGSYFISVKLCFRDDMSSIL